MMPNGRIVTLERITPSNWTICSCDEEPALYRVGDLLLGRRCLVDLVERALEDYDVRRDLELRGVLAGGAEYARAR